MFDVTAMVYARIVGAGLAIDGFNIGPAIFSDRAPDAYVFGVGKYPAIVIAAPAEDESADLYTENYRSVTQDVRVYQFDGGSTVDLDATSRAIRALFDNQEAVLTLAGGVVILANANGPVGAPTTDAAIFGRLVTLKFLIQET